MEFVAIDFETANPNLSSICQVGLVKFREGKIVDSWEALVNPDDYFHDMNCSVHGIDSTMVSDAPKWIDIHRDLEKWMQGAIVVSHTSFDRLAFHRACEKEGVSSHICTWLDSSRVSRRAWPEFSYSGYGLKNLARHFGIAFTHHNAKEDARAAGEIVLLAVEHSGRSIEEWIVHSHKPISQNISRIQLSGNPTGPLFGETLVFTGSLIIPRSRASGLAADAGCNVDPGVTKRTTILVVGDQDIQKLEGREKSSKHRKAEGLIMDGQQLRIIGESDFESLLSNKF